MQITINTKEDSHEEIRKVISLLTHLIGETPKTNDFFASHSPTSETTTLFNMFDNPATPAQTIETPKLEVKKTIHVIPY